LSFKLLKNLKNHHCSVYTVFNIPIPSHKYSIQTY